MNITITGGFSRPSIVQDYDCSLSIQERDDVTVLMSRKVTDSSILTILAEDLRCRSQKLKKTDERKGGREWHGEVITPVRVQTGRNIHHSSQHYGAADNNPTKSDITATVMIHSHLTRITEEVTSSVHRPWLPIVNYLMTEECQKNWDSISACEIILWTSVHSNNDVISWC